MPCGRGRDQAAALAQAGQDMAVVGFERVAVQAGQAAPAQLGRDAAEADQLLLLVHLEEQQVGELLDVVAVGHAVVAQDVAVVPQALDDGGGAVGHGEDSLVRSAALGAALAGLSRSSAHRIGLSSMYLRMAFSSRSLRTMCS